MALFKTMVLYLFLSVVSSHEIKASHTLASNHSRIVKIQLRELLELCFPDQLNPVAITPDLADMVSKIHDKNTKINMSVLIVDITPSSSAIEAYGVERKFGGFNSYPSYVLSGSSLDFLKKVVSDIQKWDPWTSARLIFTVGSQCQDASKVLEYIWESRGLSSYFVCPSKNFNGTVIYTMNPHEIKAPKVWKKVRMQNRPPDSWPIYEMSFKNNKSICSNFTFGKAESSPDSFNLRISQGGVFLDSKKPFFQGLLGPKNATSHENNTQVEPKNPLSKYESIMRFSNKGSFIIVTKKRSTVLFLSQIISQLLTFRNLIIVLIISLLVFLIIYLSQKYLFVAAALDHLLFMLNIRILTSMSRLCLRMTFTSVALFVIIFSPPLQSQFSSLISQSVHSNVETLKDLRDNDFHIFYSSKAITSELQGSQLWDAESFKKYIHFLEEDKKDNCLKIVEKNSTIACLIDFDSFEDIDVALSSHISSEAITQQISVFTPQEWPLNRQGNQVITKLLETGHLDYVEKRLLFKSLLQRKKLKEKIQVLKKFQHLDSKDSGLLDVAITLIIAWVLVIYAIEKLSRKVEALFDRRELETFLVRREIAAAVKKANFIADRG